MPVNGEGNGLAAPEISLPAATVERSVTIQQFLPKTLFWHADPVVLSDHWRKVADEEQLVSRISAAPEEADDAPLNVAAVDPGKAAVIEVQLVQRRLAAIEGIEVAHPPL